MDKFSTKVMDVDMTVPFGAAEFVFSYGRRILRYWAISLMAEVLNIQGSYQRYRPEMLQEWIDSIDPIIKEPVYSALADNITKMIAIFEEQQQQKESLSADSCRELVLNIDVLTHTLLAQLNEQEKQWLPVLLEAREAASKIGKMNVAQSGIHNNSENNTSSAGGDIDNSWMF